MPSDLSYPSVIYMGVSKNNGTRKSSILIGFSIIFTIHFGGFPPIFGGTSICLSWIEHIARSNSLITELVPMRCTELILPTGLVLTWQPLGPLLKVRLLVGYM